MQMTALAPGTERGLRDAYLVNMGPAPSLLHLLRQVGSPASWAVLTGVASGLRVHRARGHDLRCSCPRRPVP